MLLIIAAVGAGLRFYRLGELPPGLYQDEAYYGLDALSVAQGARPIYFPANNGREPLYIYLAAISLSVLGRTPAAERLPSAILGTLTIPAAYALGRSFGGQRLGLMAAALTAFTFWPLALSRIGFRAVSLPFVAALSLACAASGWRSRRAWLVVVGGLLYGLTFYTYLAARFAPLALIAFGIFWYIARRESFPPARWLIAFGLPALVVVIPLGLYAARNPALFFGRAAQVSVLSESVNHGDLAGMLFHNLLSALGLFVWRGDGIARHNLPGRPVFDPLMSLAFVAGLIVCLRRALSKERDLASAFALTWAATMLLPTILAEDTPHFLRAVGVMPVMFLIPAMAVEEVFSRWKTSESAEADSHRALVGWIVGLVVAASLALSVRDYFFRYVRDPNTGYLFQSAAVELAREANRTTGIGWQGGLSEGDDDGGTSGQVFLDRRLWDNFPSLRFLIPASDRFTLVDDQHPPEYAGAAALYVWPYEDPRPMLRGIPPGVEIAPHAGPLARGDLEPAAYSLYSTYEFQPSTPRGSLAHFEGGFELEAAALGRGARQIDLTLVWRAKAAPGKDYQVFAQALVGAEVVSQADGPLGTSLYPSRWWRAGEVVREARTFVLPLQVNVAEARLVVGLYDPLTGDRLRRTDAPGDSFEIAP